MAGRRERERKAAHERVYKVMMSGFEPLSDPAYVRWFVDQVDAYRSPRPRAGEKFAVDHDGTIILHPSQWKVIA